MIYCVLCGSHVPGHDMVQAWGATVCRSHVDEVGAPPETMKFWSTFAALMNDSPIRPTGPKNKPAPDIDIRG